MDRSGINHKMMIKMMMAESFILSGADWRSNEVGWMASEEGHFASDTPDHPCQHRRGWTFLHFGASPFFLHHAHQIIMPVRSSGAVPNSEAVPNCFSHHQFHKKRLLFQKFLWRQMIVSVITVKNVIQHWKARQLYGLTTKHSTGKKFLSVTNANILPK